MDAYPVQGLTNDQRIGDGMGHLAELRGKVVVLHFFTFGCTQ